MKRWLKRSLLIALHLTALPAGANILAPVGPALRVAPSELPAGVDPRAGANVNAVRTALSYRPGSPPVKINAPLLRVFYAAKPRPALARSSDAGRPETASRLETPMPYARAREPVITVNGTGSGQAGYVHFFLIRRPDDILETQVGIELPDQRIAWSFLELGVGVSPFIQSGKVEVNGRIYGVEHLYGIRPSPDDKFMRELQAEVAHRVAPWVDDATEYCELKPPRGVLCLSCLGFVMRILWPGKTPEYPALPRDFNRVAPDTYYTTEDLLLYLAGLHGVATQEARRKRIDELTVPPAMREELLRLVNVANPKAAASAPTRNTDSGQHGSAAGSPPKAAPQRLRPTRKL